MYAFFPSQPSLPNLTQGLTVLLIPFAMVTVSHLLPFYLPKVLASSSGSLSLRLYLEGFLPCVAIETLDNSLSCWDAESTRNLDRAIVLKIEKV